MSGARWRLYGSPASLIHILNMCRRGRRHKARASLAASDIAGGRVAKRKGLFQQHPLADVGMCMRCMG